MPTQSDLARRLRTTTDPVTQRDLALELLTMTRSRQHIDQALHVLLREEVQAELDYTHRPALRTKALYYFDSEDRDSGGLLREQLVRLLTTIGDANDVDIFMQAAATYHRQPVNDAAQNLRAAALHGLLRHDTTLAAAYATRLLGEADTSPLNGEPTITAMGVLALCGQPLPVYQFVLAQGEAFAAQGLGEIIGKAFEVLVEGLPQRLFEELAQRFAAHDVPIISSGIADAIINARAAGLYPLLEQLLSDTSHIELHHTIVILMAAARDDELTSRLLELARISPRAFVDHFVDALELLPPGKERDAALERLRGPA